MTGFDKEPSKINTDLNNEATNTQPDELIGNLPDYKIPVDEGRLTAAPERQVGTDPSQDTIDRLSDINIAPKITNTDAVFAGEYHESGIKSTPVRSGFDHEPATLRNDIPKNFKDPIPIREVKEKSSIFKRLFGG